MLPGLLMQVRQKYVITKNQPLSDIVVVSINE